MHAPKFDIYAGLQKWRMALSRRNPSVRCWKWRSSIFIYNRGICSWPSLYLRERWMMTVTWSSPNTISQKVALIPRLVTGHGMRCRERRWRTPIREDETSKGGEDSCIRCFASVQILLERSSEWAWPENQFYSERNKMCHTTSSTSSKKWKEPPPNSISQWKWKIVTYIAHTY